MVAKRQASSSEQPAGLLRFATTAWRPSRRLASQVQVSVEAQARAAAASSYRLWRRGPTSLEEELGAAYNACIFSVEKSRPSRRGKNEEAWKGPKTKRRILSVGANFRDGCCFQGRHNHSPFFPTLFKTSHVGTATTVSHAKKSPTFEILHPIMNAGPAAARSFVLCENRNSLLTVCSYSCIRMDRKMKASRLCTLRENTPGCETE